MREVFYWRFGEEMMRLWRVLWCNPLRCNRRRWQRIIVAETALVENQLVKTICLRRRYRTCSLERSLLYGSSFIDWMDR